MRHFYGCKLEDDVIRMRSSSGGVFTALASAVLDQGGIIYGAAFTENYRDVHHIAVKNINELSRLRGSKYIQSNLGHTFKEIKNHLESQHNVLFSGTPCQIAALRKFLGELSMSTLYCCDIVCHGVAENKIFHHYLDGLEQIHDSKVCFVNFRDKMSGWNNADFVVRFVNDTELREKVRDNAFMRGFIGNLYLRSVCANCQFKDFKSNSDLTIGDFWGATELGGYNDNIGISIVSVNSVQGHQLFEKSKAYLKDIKEVDEKTAYTFNESIYKSSTMHPKQREFYDRYEDEDFISLVTELIPKNVSSKTSYFNSIMTRLKRFLLRFS